jgi:hypothetical protein
VTGSVSGETLAGPLFCAPELNPSQSGRFLNFLRKTIRNRSFARSDSAYRAFVHTYGVGQFGDGITATL